MAEPLEVPAPVPRGTARVAVVFGLAAVVAGLAALVVANMIELSLAANLPWRQGLLAPEGEPLYPGTIPVRVRPIPEHYVEDLPLTVAAQEMRKVLETEDFPVMRERIVEIDLPEAEWQRLTASGRPPVSGAYEALAGELARFDSFELDGRRFTVTGRMPTGTSGLVLAYLVPRHAAVDSHFSAEAGATEGWADPVGLQHIQDAEFDSEAAAELQLVGGISRTTPAVSWLAYAGLALVAFGGAVVHVAVFKTLGRRWGHLVPALRDAAAHSRVLVAMHVLLYGTMFSLSAVAIASPLALFQIQAAVQYAFSEGPLGHIGAAYASENVLHAALMTFLWNYGMATVVYTFLPSLFIPWIGVAKNVLSFALAGFVMAPVVAGAAGKMTFHSITMVLELEAYIFACAIIAMYPVHMFHAIARAEARHVWHALGAMGSAALIAGIMLAVAALYEAATIIAFT